MSSFPFISHRMFVAAIGRASRPARPASPSGGGRLPEERSTEAMEILAKLVPEGRPRERRGQFMPSGI